MKRLLLFVIALSATMLTALADNRVIYMDQLTNEFLHSAEEDLHIKSATPFSDEGIVNIINTDHAVVILDSVRPSQATRLLAAHVKINGAKAVNNNNCQVKMYNRGTIILPYGTSTKPLTIFEEPNYGGESTNALTEGHNGSGYMKDLPKTWNNRIRSFKLKRGYMVTFALKAAGRGYSRCFIADKADLEVNVLPTLMDKHITSYRIFKWYDTSKAGIADYLDATVCSKLGVTSTFTWGKGNSMLPDVEVVPHHIKENWPTASELGSTNYSPHMKTNNEPINKSDDAPTDLPTILSNWESLMATGMRLCTPSSWDGSDYWNATGFLAEFLDSIDARGWRCDIIDLHGYWNEGSFTTNVNQWASKFQRPVWISEWVWGSSWGPAGIFAQASSRDNPTAADLQLNKTVVGRILENLNANNAVERYFYWNGEANCSKIYRDGRLTPAGEYFATMKTPLSYTGYGNYVPKVWRLNSPTLKGTFTASNGLIKLTWDNPNGELATTITLECRKDAGQWQAIQQYDGSENESKSSFTLTQELTEAGNYSFRVHEVSYEGKNIYSNIIQQKLGGSEGTAALQYGTITTKAAEVSYNYFIHPFDEQPVVITGCPTNHNMAAGMVDNILTMNQSKQKYNYFQFRLNRWKSDASVAAKNNEDVNYIVVPAGRGTIGSLNYEAAYLPDKVGKDVVEVTFSQPFAEAPIVFASPMLATTGASACMWRVTDITPQGFKLQLMQETCVTSTLASRTVSYLAIERGTTSDGHGTLFTVLDSELTFKSANQPIDFGASLTAPRVLVQLQSNNGQSAAMLRIGTVTAEQASLKLSVDKSDAQHQPSSSNPITERVAAIVMSTDPNYDAIRDITASGTQQTGSKHIFDLSGRRLNNTMLKPGIYIIDGRKVMKTK